MPVKAAPSNGRRTRLLRVSSVSPSLRDVCSKLEPGRTPRATNADAHTSLAANSVAEAPHTRPRPEAARDDRFARVEKLECVAGTQRHPERQLPIAVSSSGSGKKLGSASVHEKLPAPLRTSFRTRYASANASPGLWL